MNAVISELLILGLVIAAAGLLAYTIAPPEPEVFYEMKVTDAYPPATSGELFDVIMVSGNMRYDVMKVVLVNSTTGAIVGESFYRNGNMTGTISANVNDADGSFNAGDFLRFRGSVSPGIYRVIISDGKHLAFDGRVLIR